MKFRTLTSAAAIALLGGALNAATLVIPASGTGPGANGSRWATDITLHNSGIRPIAATISFHDQSGATTVPLTLPSRTTQSLQDIVGTTFGRVSATGALVIDVDDSLARRLTVTSRTYNRSETGELGQDVPAIPSTDALSVGETGVLIGPDSAVDFRFNFGLYALEATTIHWQLLRADGTIAAEKDAAYGAGVQMQYNAGVAALFGADPQNDDTVYAAVQSGRAMVYGSAIDQRTGDPTFVPGNRALRDIAINFAGVDVNQDGQVDVPDSNGAGTPDRPIDVYKTLFPNFLRLIATGPHGEAVTFQLLDSVPDAIMLDTTRGVLEVFPSGQNKRGDIETLRVLASTSSDSAVLLIPIRYQ